MTDRIADQLLRIARDPASGRLRRPARLDPALRAALFAELAMDGRLVTAGGAPAVTGAEPAGDRLFDGLARAVAGRGPIVWPRWYRHVRVDRRALIGELTAAGRWSRRGGLRTAYHDQEAADTAQLAEHVRAVLDGRGEIRDGKDAVLAVLAAMCGALGDKPRATAYPDEFITLLAHVGDDAELSRRTVHAALDGASDRIDRPHRSGSLARRPRRSVLFGRRGR